MKTYEQEALSLAENIWKDDIKIGGFEMSKNTFSSDSYGDPDMDPDPLDADPTEGYYKFNDHRSIFLLKNLGYIEIIYVYFLYIREYKFMPEYTDFSPDDVGDIQYGYAIDGYSDSLLYKKLKAISPNEDISYAYKFEVLPKLKDLTNLREIEQDILKARMGNLPVTIVSFEKLKITNEGGLYWEDKLLRKVKIDSKRVCFLMALMNDKKGFVTTDILKATLRNENFGILDSDTLNDEKQNANKLLKDSPYKISKTDNGYKLFEDKNQ